jgi:hypothetical protein
MSLRYAHLKTIFLKVSTPAVRPLLLWRSNLFRVLTFGGWQRRPPKTRDAEHRARTISHSSTSCIILILAFQRSPRGRQFDEKL